METIKLHLGCGNVRLEGYINIDISSHYNPDIVADLNNLPYEDNTVDEIYTDNVIEHVEDFTKAMKEMHRVLKPGGKLIIVVPYAGCTSAFIPQHRWYFSHGSFAPFHLSDVHSDYYDFHFTKITPKLKFSLGNNIIAPLANAHTFLYQQTFLSKLFPAYELEVELIK